MDGIKCLVQNSLQSMMIDNLRRLKITMAEIYQDENTSPNGKVHILLIIIPYLKNSNVLSNI